jgi:hypothetical protein
MIRPYEVAIRAHLKNGMHQFKHHRAGTIGVWAAETIQSENEQFGGA